MKLGNLFDKLLIGFMFAVGIVMLYCFDQKVGIGVMLIIFALNAMRESNQRKD